MTSEHPRPPIEEQLAEMQVFRERSRKLFEHIPALVFSRSGKITHMNHAAQLSLGLEPDRLVDRTLAQAGCTVIDETGRHISPRDLPWIQSVRHNRTLSGVVTAILLPGGSCRWQQSISMPFQISESGKPISCITLFTDITRVNQSHAYLLQSHKMEAIRALTGGLTHDFNNILTSIRAAVQLLLLNTKEDSPIYEPLKDVENETLRGAELVRHLLLFSKPSEGRKQYSRLNERINLLRRLLRRTLPRNIRIDHNPAEHEILARINSSHLEQILINLAVNARDAMPNGGSLKISTGIVRWSRQTPGPVVNARAGTYARIDVSDTGCGISPDVLPRIFDPFYTTKEKQGGTGLGLTITYSIARQNNGYVLCESLPGKGATFSVFLPARRGRVRAAKIAAPAEKPRIGYETILIADDEVLITKSTARFLERYGYKTMPVYDGRSALEAFHKHKDQIDLILLDLEMPEVNGQQCLASFLADKPSTKVIALSGHILKPDEWDPVKAGARCFVQKPFDSNNLLTLIRKILDRDKR